MKWNDEYWPVLVKIYKRKPEGVKPAFSKEVVDVALELHIPPQELHAKMLCLRNPATPFVKKLMDEYSSATKLNKAVKITLQNIGLGTAGEFFEGVEMQESWELDFRPLPDNNQLMPLHLILILDLYFQLTPTTMVIETEEIQDLARKLRISATMIVRIMELFLFCDPDMPSDDFVSDELLFPVSDVWNRFGTDPVKLSAQAAQLIKYFEK